jgi:peptidoglycan/xylan/chitin deacetylase (PgdA/CDA1 family)
MPRIQSVNILMYHSISQGSGPTCIAPDTFRAQMAVLEECGYRAVALADLAGWLRGEQALPARPVVLTFDDGFEDFASHAFPQLAARGWTATVFLPAGLAGKSAGWDGHCTGRRVMSWETVSKLAEQGVDFGGHGICHVDLTRLSPEAARGEIAGSGQMIAERVGRPVRSFAVPFGRTSATVQAEIRRQYPLAVGTRLAQARRWSDPHDLPRIEMHYFRDISRWRMHLQGRARVYFAVRQVLRQAGALFRPSRTES